MCAPCSRTCRAVFSICSCDSTEHGPAITTKLPPPMRRSRTRTTVSSGREARSASLYCLERCTGAERAGGMSPTDGCKVGSGSPVVLDVSFEVDEKHVLPGPARARPRLELGEGEPVVGEHLQTAQQGAALVASTDDQARLARYAVIEPLGRRG